MKSTSRPAKLLKLSRGGDAVAWTPLTLLCAPPAPHTAATKLNLVVMHLGIDTARHVMVTSMAARLSQLERKSKEQALALQEKQKEAHALIEKLESAAPNVAQAASDEDSAEAGLTRAQAALGRIVLRILISSATLIKYPYFEGELY